MKFSIITPTHNRPEELLRCAISISNQDSSLTPNPSPQDNSGLSPALPTGEGVIQTPSEFQVEMIIINDSPDYNYTSFENNNEIKKAIEDKKIIYIKNKENKGKNYCCNLALKNLETNSIDENHYVILVDDDDWLAPNALGELHELITQLKNNKENFNYKWMVTNRCYEDGISLTKNTQNKKYINYFWNCLISKKFSGDATHIIEAALAKGASFSKNIKNGEEWYYFAQLTSNFIYKDLNTTLTAGYQSEGLTDKLKSKYIENTYLLWRDKILNFKMFLYLILRTIRVLKNKYL